MEKKVGADVEDEEGKICRVPTVCFLGCMLIATLIIFPGRLHAHGELVKVHQVSYSIGAAVIACG